MRKLDIAAADAILRASCGEQGVPIVVTDAAALTRIAGLLTEPQTARPPSSRLEGRRDGGGRGNGSHRLPAA